MKTEAIQKINKIGKAGYVITMIGRILLIIGVVGCLATMIGTALVPRGMVTLTMNGDAQAQVNLSVSGKTLPKEEQDRINSGKHSYQYLYIESDGVRYDMSNVKATDTGYTVNGSRDTTVFDVHNLSYMIIPILIAVIAALVSMIFAGRLCKAFRDCETPFADNVIRGLQQLAYSLIPWTFLSSFAEGASRNLFNGKVHLNIDLNLGMIVTVVLVFMLVAVFKYGAMLQQESDETL